MKHACLGLIVFVSCGQTAVADPTATKEILRLLNTQMEVKNFQQPMNLQFCLGYIYDKLSSQGADVPIIVDKRAFAEADKEMGNVYETEIDLKDIPPQTKLPLAMIIHLALDCIPVESTFIVRNGLIEITTKKKACTKSLLKRRVLGVFDSVPLANALADLSEQTGASIIIDAGLKEKAVALVSATFRNDVRLEDAIRVLTNQARVELVMLPSAVYVTSEEQAKKLKRK